jgi:hypothetical protein
MSQIRWLVSQTLFRGCNYKTTVVVIGVVIQLQTVLEGNCNAIV